MCAPVPKGRWAWKHEKCLGCETTKVKHKGRGLCLNCFDKKRAENPKRKAQLKNQHDKWWQRVRGTEEQKKIQRERVAQWQKERPRLHKKNWKKRNMKLSFKKFILLKNKNKTRKGIEILIDGHRVKTPILAGNGTENDNTPHKVQIFQQVYKELQAR